MIPAILADRGRAAMPEARVAASAVVLPSLSRRSLLSGLVATSASATPSIALPAPSDPDAELSALMRAFEQARAGYEAAQRYYNDCEGRYFDLKPEAPEALTIRGPLGHLLTTKWDMWRACELRSEERRVGKECRSRW